MQEAAGNLQAELGDPSAVFLVTSPAAGKVAMAVAASPAAVQASLFHHPDCIPASIFPGRPGVCLKPHIHSAQCCP